MTNSQNGNKIFGTQLSDKQREELKQALIQKLGGPDGSKPIVEYRVNFDINPEKFAIAQATFKNGIDANVARVQAAVDEGGSKLESAATLLSTSVNLASSAAIKNAENTIKSLATLQQQLGTSETIASDAMAALTTRSATVAEFNKLAIDFSAHLHVADEGLAKYTAIKEVLGEVAPKVETLIERMDGLDSKKSKFDEATVALNAKIESLVELDSTVVNLNSTLDSIRATADRVRTSSTELDLVRKYFASIGSIATVFNQIDERTKDIKEVSVALNLFNEKINEYNYSKELICNFNGDVNVLINNWEVIKHNTVVISNSILASEKEVKNSSSLISNEIELIGSNIKKLEGAINVVGKSAQTLLGALSLITQKEAQLIEQDNNMIVALERIKNAEAALTKFNSNSSGIDANLTKMEMIGKKLDNLNTSISKIDVPRFDRMLSALEDINRSKESQEKSILKDIGRHVDQIFGQSDNVVDEYAPVLEYLDFLRRRLNDNLGIFLQVLPLGALDQKGGIIEIVEEIKLLNIENAAVLNELKLAPELNIEEVKEEIKSILLFDSIGRKFSEIFDFSEKAGSEGKGDEQFGKLEGQLLTLKTIVSGLDEKDLGRYQDYVKDLKNNTTVIGMKTPIKWLKASIVVGFFVFLVCVFFIFYLNYFAPKSADTPNNNVKVATPVVVAMAPINVEMEAKKVEVPKTNLLNIAVSFLIKSCVEKKDAPSCPIEIQSKIGTLRSSKNAAFISYVGEITCKVGPDKIGYFCSELEKDQKDTPVFELCSKSKLTPAHKETCKAELDRAFVAYAITELTSEPIAQRK